MLAYVISAAPASTRLRAARLAAIRDLSHKVATISDTTMIASTIAPPTAGRCQTSLNLPSESRRCHQYAGGWAAAEMALSPKLMPALGWAVPCWLNRTVMFPGLAENCWATGAAQ